MAPLAPERYRVQFTASAETYAKLRLAQDLLRHQIPDGDVGAVLDRALTALVEKLTKQKLAATAHPRARRRGIQADRQSGAGGRGPQAEGGTPEGGASSGRSGPERSAGAATPATGGRDATQGSRHIPAEVKRAVWERDGGRCAFVSEAGRRCTERGRLEFHHVRPYAAGGPATVENIALRCRAHNAHEAERDFGPPRAPAWLVRERRAVYRQARSYPTRSGPSSGLRPSVLPLSAPG